MISYLSLLSDVMLHGDEVPDRTGTGTRSLFGRTLRFDLSSGRFPLLTTKKVFFRGVVEELLWMLRGSTNARELAEVDVHIWDEWADESGELGPVYGKQWRSWDVYYASSIQPYTSDNLYKRKSIDQLKQVIEQVKTNPHSRRHVVSAWNVADLEEMALAPCHCLFQFRVAAGKLDLQLYQRSADIFLGVPFNIASYSLLLLLVARECGLEPGVFTHVFGDVHLYNNHAGQAREQLSRKVLPPPTLKIAKRPKTIWDVRYKDLKLGGYAPHPAIKAPIAV